MLDERVKELHARDVGSAFGLEQLLGAARAVKEGYRRRRERAERELEMEQQRQAEERLRVRQRRKRRRVMRARGARRVVTGGARGKRKRKGLGRDHGEGMTQTKIGEDRRAAVQVDSGTDPESDGSDDEGKCRPKLDTDIEEQHARAFADMQVRAGRARAAAVSQDRARRERLRGRGRLHKRKRAGCMCDGGGGVRRQWAGSERGEVGAVARGRAALT